MGKNFKKSPIPNPGLGALEIALWLRPRAISRASGCKINASANFLVLGWRIFQFFPFLGSVLSHSQHIIDRKMVRGVAIVGSVDIGARHDALLSGKSER